MKSIVDTHLNDHIDAVEQLRAMTDEVVAVGNRLIEALRAGNKVLLCGNGGSAGDAQHIAAELVGRFIDDRRALPAIALTTDTSALTAIANDYGYDHVFARQVEGLAQRGDVLVAISTSGNSSNITRAVEAARARGCVTVGLAGKTGGTLAGMVDQSLVVPVTSTARIQECHILIGHIWCDLVERGLGLVAE